MTISRLDLDGLGSPLAIAAGIHKFAGDLPTAVPVEALCGQLDILSVTEFDTEGFEAALIMDANKAAGSILVAAGRSRKRRRYSVAHELGHFLIPTHMPDASHGFECSLDDLHLLDVKEQDRRRRVEAEANRFAAALLMPLPRIRTACASRRPSLVEVVRLADEFDVSKEAMARSYVEAHREALAVILLKHDRIVRIYRNERLFPWIVPRVGDVIPAGSMASSSELHPGQFSQVEECDPGTWLGDSGTRRVELLTEHLLAQRDGFAMLLLHAELGDEDEADDENETFRALR
ncbi:MAG: ImmA/IrrE family metallo-endopeptidase [Sphingomonas sp.]